VPTRFTALGISLLALVASFAIVYAVGTPVATGPEAQLPVPTRKPSASTSAGTGAMTPSTSVLVRMTVTVDTGPLRDGKPVDTLIGTFRLDDPAQPGAGPTDTPGGRRLCLAPKTSWRPDGAGWSQQGGSAEWCQPVVGDGSIVIELRRQGPVLIDVALASLTGAGLAVAALAVRRDITHPRLLAGIAIAVVALCVLAARRLAPPSRPTGSPAPRSQAAQPAFSWDRSARILATTGNGPARTAAPRPRWRPPAPAREASEAPLADPGTPPVSVAVPVRGGEWRQVAAAVAASRVVQCPRCGDFGVEISTQQPGFAFRCHRCGDRWRWKPGAPWPVSVIRPRLGRQPSATPGAPSTDPRAV
jgi:hypothetical protein